MVNYGNLECIKKMDEGELKSYNELVEEYSPRLLKIIRMDGSAYTLHDFDHHCFDIYRIISTVLFDERIAYGQELLSKREIFILNVAVLFHDISMSDAIVVKRENHSKVSADYVRNEYDNTSSVLRTKTDLTSTEIKAIRAIITAHSNIKDNTVSPEKNGLNAPELKDYTDKYGKRIHTKALAAVLRLADELDVSCERVGDGRIEEQLKRLEERYNRCILEGESLEANEICSYIDSYNHWRKLHYIEEIKKSEHADTIQLVVNDDYVDQRLDEGDTESAIADVLLGVLDEIQRKLDECVERCSTDEVFPHLVLARKVELVTKIEPLEAAICKRKGYSELQSVKIDSNTEKGSNIGKGNEKKMPIVVDKALEEEIFQEINKRGLIKFGHFRRHDRYCARDWINTKEIVETKKILQRICETMAKHIMTNDEIENIIVLGIDMVGALVAARVAFTLQKPFSYVGSKNDVEYDSIKEKEFDPNSYEKIILITESMVSCDTVNEIIKRYKIGSKICSIYTLLYRSSGEYSLKIETDAPVYSINNTFPIELFDNTNCVYGEENCKALNRRLSTDCIER